MSNAVLDKMSGTGKSKSMLVLHAIEYMYIFAMVKVFGRLAYKKQYLTGRHFAHLWSPGWRWAYNGMFAKLFKGSNRGVPWPASSQGSFSPNVEFDVDDLDNFQIPAYFQAFNGGTIKIGKGTQIARGTSLITTNHDPLDPSKHLEPKDVVIGEQCWLGSNVTIMPGVILGPHTVVAANAAVTKSFPQGFCVIGGVPARMIKELDVDKRE